MSQLTLTDTNVDEVRTDKGAITNASSLNANVDLFFLAGASRGKDISNVFELAYNESPEAATRTLLWARDVRGGAGERSTFRKLFVKLISLDEDFARRVLARVPELGRWDDVFAAFNTPLETDALRMIAKASRNPDGLWAKWMPRKGENANKIRAYLRMTPKAYRKLLVNNTNVVEQKMCSKEWNKIEYGKLPSVASARYQAAFGRNDPERYMEYRNKLQSGEENINAGAVYPYDVVRSLRSGDRKVASAQWDALPDYLGETTSNILPIVDTSGSMGVGVSGSVTAMDVAISLGMYISERNRGIFENAFMTFSSSPEVIVLDKAQPLAERYNSMSRANWGMSTNLMAAFDLVLSSANRHNISEDEMPSTMIILSDMEFDRCVHGGKDLTAFSAMSAKYKQAGYQMPKVVFWNLYGREGNIPVTFSETGVALVSGFSPAIMKSVVAKLGDVTGFTPENLMLDVILDERYDF